MKQLATVVAIRSNGSLQQGELDKAHPATFPLALPFAHIEAMTTGGDCVADPFSGSGTTLIACEQLGRKCRAMEIAPGYVAVALQRWADATGKTPTL
jgi:DNA modification methylase